MPVLSEDRDHTQGTGLEYLWWSDQLVKRNLYEALGNGMVQTVVGHVLLWVLASSESAVM